MLRNAPVATPAFLFLSDQNNPTPFVESTLVPIPQLLLLPFATDANGEVLISVDGIGGGPVNAYLQYVVSDPDVSFGLSLSNALELNIEP